MTPTARCRGLRCASTNAHICAQTSRRGATPLFCASRVVPFRASTRAAASLTLRARVPRSCATRRVTRWSAATTLRTFGRSRCVCAARRARCCAASGTGRLSARARGAARAGATRGAPLRRALRLSRLRAQTAQALPCVIFLHGNSGCRVDAYDAVRVLLPLNITVFALDLSGSGLSGGCVGARLAPRRQTHAATLAAGPRARTAAVVAARAARAARIARRRTRYQPPPGRRYVAVFDAG